MLEFESFASKKVWIFYNILKLLKNKFSVKISAKNIRYFETSKNIKNSDL